MAELFRKIILNIYGWQFKSVLLCSLVLIIVWIFSNYYAPKKFSKIINMTALLIIVAAIVFFTMTNRNVKPERTVRLIPFTKLSGFKRSYLRTLWLNAFLFLPIGLSLPFVLSEKVKHKALVTILAALAFSISIEAVQFIFKLGLCETDDIIMNTLGAAIGSLSFIAVKKMRSKQLMRNE